VGLPLRTLLMSKNLDGFFGLVAALANWKPAGVEPSRPEITCNR